MKKYYWLIIVVILLGGGFWFYNYQTTKVISIEVPPAIDYQQFVNTTTPPVDLPVAKPVDEVRPTSAPVTKPPVSLPTQVNLAVPFTSQAPIGDWSEPWQNACEEASFLMVDYYYQGKTLPKPIEVQNILGGMVDWQIKNWGDHHNLPVAETVDFIKQNFTYQAEVIQDLTVEKIKSFLQKGIPVIVPADGRKLDNPYFSGEGPEYHMLVVKGFVDNKFITNDPGTKRGADFVYTDENLMSAIADWDKKMNQAIGPKRGIVVYNN